MTDRTPNDRGPRQERDRRGPRGKRPSSARGPARGGPRRGQRPSQGEREERKDPARDRVYRRVAKQARRFPNQLLITPINDEGMSGRDAAFAHALYDAVMRRWVTLRHMVQLGLNRDFDELDDHVRAALLCGAAQMLLLDSVPPRAAINESVTWIKRVSRRQGPGSLVNAALRRVAETIGEEPEPSARVGTYDTPPEPTPRRWPPRLERYEGGRSELPLPDGRALPLAGEALPEDSLQRLAVATGHPVELLRLWSKSMPLREVRSLALHGIIRPPVILNTAHAKEAPPAELAAAHSAPGHHVFTGSRAQLVALLEGRHDLWVQDPASSLAVESVTDLSPSLIVDACAGQGTKTRQLAETFPEARIVATDIDHPRRAALEQAFAAGPHADRVTVIHHDALDDWAGKADLALLDVPCSNTGVLARRVEARYRASEAAITELQSLQRQIVANAVKLLAPGGAILYSTCSLDPRENEEMVEWATRWHGFESTRVHRRMPSGGPGEAETTYSDGSFAALLR
jgi:16S rRNA (cytosine967-C5)-methyltransferase